ncbi:MAG: hypothetical protein WC332_00035 [Clostridia bacterium]|jgi:hypothetical protein
MDTSDTFLNSMNTGFALGHQMEQEKRLQQQQALMVQQHQMQMQKMSAELAQHEIINNIDKPENAPYKDAIEKRYGKDAIPIIKMGLKPKELGEEKYTIDNVLAEKVRNKELSLKDALQLKYEHEQKNEIVADLRKFETVTGIKPETRGTPEYEKAFLKFKSAQAGATHITNAPDTEAKDLAKEQKKNLIAERKLKLKYGTLPTVAITGETIFPTNPKTKKQFTQDEWATASEAVYNEVSSMGGKKSINKPKVTKEWEIYK